MQSRFTPPVEADWVMRNGIRFWKCTLCGYPQKLDSICIQTNSRLRVDRSLFLHLWLLGASKPCNGPTAGGWMASQPGVCKWLEQLRDTWKCTNICVLYTVAGPICDHVQTYLPHAGWSYPTDGGLWCWSPSSGQAATRDTPKQCEWGG